MRPRHSPVSTGRDDDTKINKNLPSESQYIHTFAFLPYPFDPFFVPCDFYSIWNSMGGMGTQRTVTQRCDNKRSAKRGAHSVPPRSSMADIVRMRWKARQLSAGILNGWRRLGSAPRKRLSGRLLRGKRRIYKISCIQHWIHSTTKVKRITISILYVHTIDGTRIAPADEAISNWLRTPRRSSFETIICTLDLCGTGCSKSAQTSVYCI